MTVTEHMNSDHQLTTNFGFVNTSASKIHIESDQDLARDNPKTFKFMQRNPETYGIYTTIHDLRFEIFKQRRQAKRHNMTPMINQTQRFHDKIIIKGEDDTSVQDNTNVLQRSNTNEQIASIGESLQFQSFSNNQTPSIATHQQSFSQVPGVKQMAAIRVESFSMGPSILLKSSGSKLSVPRTYDYHTNLEKDIRHNKASPARYKLPALCDEHHDRIDRIGVKYNPHFKFSTQMNPQAQFISKEHTNQILLTQSPPSTRYDPIVPNTFDKIARTKNGQQTARDKSFNAFMSSTRRFYEPAASVELKRVELQHGDNQSPIGKIAQAKHQPTEVPTTKFYNPEGFINLKENFGPGPAAHPDKVRIAFRTLTEEDRQDLLNKSVHRKANDRFKISGIQYIPEVQRGAQYHHSATKVPGAKYNQDQPFKRDTSPKIGSQERESNNPVKQTEVVSPQYYDTVSQFGNVSIKNM